MNPQLHATMRLCTSMHTLVFSLKANLTSFCLHVVASGVIRELHALIQLMSDSIILSGRDASYLVINTALVGDNALSINKAIIPSAN